MYSYLDLDLDLEIDKQILIDLKIWALFRLLPPVRYCFNSMTK